jgi:hypothetical protein
MFVLKNLAAVAAAAATQGRSAHSVLVNQSKVFVDRFGNAVQRAQHMRANPINGNATATYEVVPGALTGHLDGIVGARRGVRKAYTDNMFSKWTDRTGQDIAFAAAGVKSLPSRPMTGVFDFAGRLETNPGIAVRTLLGRVRGQGRESRIHAETMDGVKKAESIRSYLDVQNAWAAHSITATARKSERTSLFIPMRDKLSPAQAKALSQQAAKTDMAVVDTGRGFLVINEGNRAAMVGAMRGGLGLSVKRMVGDGLAGSPRSVKFRGDYVPNEFGAQHAGTGVATSQLRDRLGGRNAVYPDTPDLRNKAFTSLVRDETFIAKGIGAPRADIQRAREIVSKEGLGGLFAALDRGIALPALAVTAGGGLAVKKQSETKSGPATY